MSARVRAGPRFGGLSLEGLSLEDLSPGGPLLGGPPVSVPAGFGVVPIPGVGVTLGGLPVPIPGVGVMPFRCEQLITIAVSTSIYDALMFQESFSPLQTF
jgi:hypothetical protein